ncbi:MAG: hypothetical protein R3C39_01445 [Dehalococcoidia bacterium]
MAHRPDPGVSATCRQQIRTARNSGFARIEALDAIYKTEDTTGAWPAVPQRQEQHRGRFMNAGMNRDFQMKAQVIADLALQLSEVTSVERTAEIVRRALRSTGLSNATLLDEGDVRELLTAIAAEGGLVQQLAEQIAIHGIDGGSAGGGLAA